MNSEELTKEEKEVIDNTIEQEQKEMKELADNLCVFCPFSKGKISHQCDSICEGRYCEDAYYNYKEVKQKILYYFGTYIDYNKYCIHNISEGLMKDEDITVTFDIPFDLQLYPINPTHIGYTEFHIETGWSIFAISGSCCDKKKDSKTVFFINEVLTEEEMVCIIMENKIGMQIINALPFNIKQIKKEKKK